MSMARHSKFVARTIFVKNNDVEKAARTLNRILSDEGILQQYRYTRTFEVPTQTRRRVNFERVKAVYNEDMNRRIQFLLRMNREDAYPGCS